MLNKNSSDDMVWQQFFETASLTEQQRDQFKTYYQTLVDTNDIHNLTAITNIQKVVNDHFLDSLALRSFVDLVQVRSIGDIGSGAGFPGLPLKILFPHLTIYLIEVSHKKIQFLCSVIELLGLTNVEVIDLDWRTFLRKTNCEIELFCARASLQPEELMRMFKPSSPYRQAQLVYWASSQWEPATEVKPFIKRDENYVVGHKQRRLIFLGY